MAHLLSEDMKEKLSYAYFPHIRIINHREYTACYKCKEEFELKPKHHMVASMSSGFDRYYIKCPFCGEEIDY